jgi:acetyl-CoA carboxylase biotin carboxylase subunit
MLGALGSFRLEGIRSTIPVHRQILENREFVAGTYDTGLIGRMLG